MCSLSNIAQDREAPVEYCYEHWLLCDPALTEWSIYPSEILAVSAWWPVWPPGPPPSTLISLRGSLVSSGPSLLPALATAASRPGPGIAHSDRFDLATGWAEQHQVILPRRHKPIMGRISSGECHIQWSMVINIGQLYRVRCQHYLQNLNNEHIYTISIDWWQCQYVYLLYIRGPPRGLVSRLRHAYDMLAVWRYCGILMFSSDHVLVNLSRPPSAYLYCSILLHAALHKSLKRWLKTKVREDFTITEKAPTQAFSRLKAPAYKLPLFHI